MSASSPRSPRATQPRGTVALLGDRTFGPFFFGNFVSNCGNWLQNVAAAVVVYQLTRSAVMVGAVTAMLWISSLLLQPWAGALSDRVNRRRMLIAGQAIAASSATVLTAWIALVGVQGLPGAWPVLAATLVIGTGLALSTPSMQALVPALVPPEDLDQAVALNALTFNLGRAIGPAIGAVILTTFGPATAFGVNALSYFALIAALLVIRERHAPRRADRDGSVREGLRYVRSAPVVFTLLLAVTALGFGTDPVNTLTPPIADRLGGGDALVGWLVSAFGAGAVAAALTVRRVRDRVGLGELGGAGLALLGSSMLALAVAPTVPLAVAAMIAAGVGFLMAITALTTMLHQQIPEELRGRVMALWGVAFLGSRPLAALLHGSVADLVSTPAGVLVAAVMPLAASVLVLRRLRASAHAPAPT